MKHVSGRGRGRVHVASGPYVYILITTHSPVFHSLDFIYSHSFYERRRNIPEMFLHYQTAQLKHSFVTGVELLRRHSSWQAAMRCWLTSQSSF